MANAAASNLPCSSTPSLIGERERLDLLEKAEEFQKIGSWIFYHSSGCFHCSSQLLRLLAERPDAARELTVQDHRKRSNELTRSLHGILHRIPAMERELLIDQLQQSWLAGKSFQMEHRLRLADGKQEVVLHRGHTLCDSDGELIYTLGTLQQLSNQQPQAESTKLAALHDGLTGLPNRSASLSQLQKRLRQTPYNQQMALIHLDLDNFEGINDSFGSEVGNDVLRWTSSHLQDQLQEGDWLARLESDSFLIMRSRGIGCLADALQLAKQLQNSFNNVVPLLEGNLPIQLTSCIGVSIAPDHSSDASTLLQCANTALMEAKRQGKGSLKAYSTAISQKIRETLDLEQRLSQAIQRQELQLHFQPQWDRQQQLIGAEALLRWHSQRGEQIAPSRFIPIAEKSGLIHNLGRWVNEQALAQLHRWRSKGLLLPKLAINLSAMQLIPTTTPLDTEVLNLCNQWQIPPKQLELELTETALIANQEHATKVLGRLAEAGVSLAIDDFGTGFSSLKMLQQLPLRCLKIDRCFVKNLPGNAADHSIVKATILMAHELGLTCLAEGVETRAQHETLLQLNCDHFQGYRLGKPRSADAFAEWLRN